MDIFFFVFPTWPYIILSIFVLRHTNTVSMTYLFKLTTGVMRLSPPLEGKCHYEWYIAWSCLHFISYEKFKEVHADIRLIHTLNWNWKKLKRSLHSNRILYTDERRFIITWDEHVYDMKYISNYDVKKKLRGTTLCTTLCYISQIIIISNRK
jgi:hypothetical protein